MECAEGVVPVLIISTGPVKPPPSGSGLPDRFDRKPVEIACVIGLDRYTGRFDWFTGRFDLFEFKSKFKIACVIGLERYTGRFDQFTKWALMVRLIFFFYFLV